MERMKGDISIGVDVDGTLTEGKIDIDLFSLSYKELEKKCLDLLLRKE